MIYLFRGKRIDNGAWETGFLVVERFQCSDAKCFIADKMTGFHTPVETKTVGMWTGLEDKNGVQVFEGDVCEITRACVWAKVEIIWGSAAFWGREMLVDNSTIYPLHNLEIDGNSIKVIGNIHDKKVGARGVRMK